MNKILQNELWQGFFTIIILYQIYGLYTTKDFFTTILHFVFIGIGLFVIINSQVRIMKLKRGIVR